MKTITTVAVRNGVASVEQIGTDLKSMQAVVGGWLEHVRLRGPFEGLHLWVNEEGRLHGLECWQTPFHPAPIAGDFFITRCSVDGETTTLEPADLELLAKAVAL